LVGGAYMAADDPGKELKRLFYEGSEGVL
jgi:hypothetical protein